MADTALPRLALVGDRGNHGEPAHPVIEELLPALGAQACWVATDKLDDAGQLREFHGIWVVPGAPYRSQAGVHLAVRYAREQRIPFLGTCGGFFSALIEHAQNVLRMPEVIGVEDEPARLVPLMVPLTCSVTSARTPLRLRPGSRLADIYGRTNGIEEFLRCAYGLADYFMAAASQHALSYSAWDTDGAPRALELSGHPFYLGLLFQPELSSTPEHVHPVLAAFLDAVRRSAASAAPGPQEMSRADPD